MSQGTGRLLLKEDPGLALMGEHDLSMAAAPLKGRDDL